jgi:hypothetical protein
MLLELCNFQVGSTSSHVSNIEGSSDRQGHLSNFIKNAATKTDISGRIELDIGRVKLIEWGEERVYNFKSYPVSLLTTRDLARRINSQ